MPKISYESESNKLRIEQDAPPEHEASVSFSRTQSVLGQERRENFLSLLQVVFPEVRQFSGKAPEGIEDVTVDAGLVRVLHDLDEVLSEFHDKGHVLAPSDSKSLPRLEPLPSPVDDALTDWDFVAEFESAPIHKVPVLLKYKGRLTPANDDFPE